MSGDKSNMKKLLATLEEATGADHSIDRTIAEILGEKSAGYTSDASSSRELVQRVLPDARLQVGYDVSGVFPNAVLHDADRRFSVVSPTVPLAILRVLIEALLEREPR